MPAPTLAGATLADLMAELRASSRRRAPEGGFIDLPGITGVGAGVSPVAWVAPWADRTTLRQLVAATPTLCELQVAVDRDDIVEALADTGWVARGMEEQIVIDQLPDQCALPDGYHAVALTEPGQMASVRSLLIDAFDAPRAIIEGAYPDDFHLRAAPVWLWGVVDGDGALVGCIAWRRQHRSAMMFALAVAGAHRGAGIGAALVTRAVREALLSGASFVHANVTPESLQLAAALGGQHIGSWTHLVRTAG